MKGPGDTHCPSKVQGTHTLFNGATLDSVRVDHRCSHVTMPQQLLNRPYVVIGLQEMTGETVAEGRKEGRKKKGEE